MDEKEDNEEFKTFIKSDLEEISKHFLRTRLMENPFFRRLDLIFDLMISRIRMDLKYLCF